MAEYVEGRLLAKLKPGVSIDDIRAVVAGAEIVDAIGDITVISFEDSPVLDEVDALNKSGLVEFAQPDHIYTGFLPTPYHPNDPYYQAGNQWGLFNQGQNGGTAGADIGAPYAWRLLYEAGKPIGSTSVKVGVIDTGVDYNHPDLSDNCKKADGFDFYNMDSDPMDDGDHGTHVAGIIGAKGNNGQGVCGVAWSCRIYPIKSLGSSMQATDTSVLYGLDHAEMMGCHIVNMSFGSYSFSQAVADKIAEMSSVLFVCAAGNDASDNDTFPVYPASLGFNNIISVCNTNNKDQLNAQSNYGAASVHVAAPGTNICSTLTGNSYVWLSGTSMAAPMVTGIAVLLKGAFPELTAQQIRTRILNGVDIIPALSGKCATGGRVNAYKALSGLIDDPTVVLGIKKQCAVRDVATDEYYARKGGVWAKIDSEGYTAGTGLTLNNHEFSLSILDSAGKIKSDYLPSSVFGALTYAGLYNPANPLPPGEQGKYYVISHAGYIGETGVLPGDWLVWRDETTYDIILNSSSSVCWGNIIDKPDTFPAILGETSDTAYRGDRGKFAYDHATSQHAPPDAEKNVQADWNETDVNSDAFIRNKPTIYTPENLGGKAKVYSGDASADYLLNKLVAPAGGGININMTQDAGGNAFLEFTGTQVNYWLRVASVQYVATPASTSSITTVANLTSVLQKGMGIKYKIGGAWYYGIIRDLTSNVIGVAGAPLSGPIQQLEVCDSSRTAHVDLFINGVFNGAANTTLLQTAMRTRFRWMLGEARLVQISHVCYLADSGATQPAINLRVNNAPVCTSNSNAGRRTSQFSWVDTVVDINPANYVVPFGASIEVSTDVGGNGNAECLTVMGVFVLV